MLVDKITPGDSRVSHREAVLNGQTYRTCLPLDRAFMSLIISLTHTDYIHGVPQHGKFKATIFLIHGWPDLSYGWRYQIPFLIQQNMRVIVPDMMGYGRTVSRVRWICCLSITEHPRNRMLHAHRLLICASTLSRELLTTFWNWPSNWTPRKSFWVAMTGAAS
jgi:pimeloyl-ACP methyl ester carboxylesterase